MDLFSQTDEKVKAQFGEEWYRVLEPFLSSSQFQSILETVEKERTEFTIYPDPPDVFKAFRLTDFDKVKVIIIGQDPYHNGNADGLAFSCKMSLSPSLRQVLRMMIKTIMHERQDSAENIEAYTNEYCARSSSMNLEYLAKQGVLLYNPCLTVRKASPNSHKNIGWDTFTYHVFRALMRRPDVIWLAWGRNAQDIVADVVKASRDIKLDKFMFLKEEHPAAASHQNRVWNCNHFFQINKYYKASGKEPIKWLNNA